MANNTTINGIPNSTDSSTNLITINTAVQVPIKLTSSNYPSWRLQFQTLLTGYDLLGYINGSKPCPSSTITTTENNTIPNTANLSWIRQDQLILNAIVGSLSPNIVPFIANSVTSKQAWDILATTYAKPSRGRIKNIKQQLKTLTKGSMSITDFLHTISSSR